MLNLDTATHTMLASSTGSIFNLYEVYYADLPADPLRWCNSDTEITYKNNLYTPQTIKQGDISYGSDGSVSDLPLTVGNAERQIQYYIERYGLILKPVKVMQVFVSIDGVVLGDITNSYVIKSAKVTQLQADFTLSLGFDLFKATLPARRMFARYCSNQFKDSCCNYIGAESTCSKTFADCKRKGNLKNFSGFPGLRNERLYF